MNYWLVKTEPETFGWEDLQKKGISMWDGVRNYQARNYLRKMKTEDMVFIYHSGKDPGIVAISCVVKEYYPDPTAIEGDWSTVDLKAVRKLKNRVPLQTIRKIKNLQHMELLKNPRLSVQHITQEEYKQILKLSEMTNL